MFFFLDKKEPKNQGDTCFAKIEEIAAVATQAVRYHSLVGSSGRGYFFNLLTLTS
jgi:hypothetical protein